jgi:hypothetical protein
MQLQINPDFSGYMLQLSKEETQSWALRPNSAWPASTIAGRNLRLEVDARGLCEINLGGELDESELYGIVSDHLPPVLRHLWPVWQKEG